MAYATIRTCLEQSRVVLLVRLSADGVIQAANPALQTLVGRDGEALVGRPLASFLARDQAEALPVPVKPTDDRFFLNLVDERQDPHTYECSIVDANGQLCLIGEPLHAEEQGLRNQLIELNNQLAAASRENARTSRELAEALEDLQASHWHIRKIQEVLPICMECGKVKGESQWEDVVSYLRKHARFLSHGYCSECAEQVREDMGSDRHERGTQ